MHRRNFLGFVGLASLAGVSVPKIAPPTFNGARARGNNQSIPSGFALTTVVFDTEVFDAGNFYDPAFPDRLTIPVCGYYMVGCNINWQPNPVGFRLLSIRDEINPSPIASSVVQAVDTPGMQTRQETNALCYLEAGAWITVRVGQDSGIDLLVNVSGIPNPQTPSFWIYRVG